MKQVYTYESHEISAVVIADDVDEAVNLTETLKKNRGCKYTTVNKFDLCPISTSHSSAYIII